MPTEAPVQDGVTILRCMGFSNPLSRNMPCTLGLSPVPERNGVGCRRA